MDESEFRGIGDTAASDVVREHVRASASGRMVRHPLSETRLDDSTLDATEALIQARSTDTATAPQVRHFIASTGAP